MKLLLTNTNSKGQIVIPKLIRDALDITEETILSIELYGEKIVIQPLRYIDLEDAKKSYKDLLKETKGTWPKEAYVEYQKNRKKEKQLNELGRM